MPRPGAIARRVAGLAAGVGIAIGLAGCSLAPPYHPVTVALPAGFAEIPAGWTSATPMDAAPRGAWWTAFGDPVLDDLETRAEAASPTLATALARHDEALATLGIAASALVPEVDATGSAERVHLSKNRPLSTGSDPTYNDFSVGGVASYELDLWGRVRNSVAAARDEAGASGADLASARLSLQAAVADAYARLRGLDAQQDLLARTVAAYARALDLTVRRHQGGVDSGTPESQARTVLGNARAQVSDVANRRAATEHELAALVGAVASDFHLAPAASPLAAPDLPTGTPSALLQRRPDIAAAERRMAEANARIGVARAALFPTITLGAAGGYETTTGALFAAPNAFWGLGPASVNLPIFDGGKAAHGVRLAHAQYDEAAANYRGTVLTAMREAEDAIAAQHHLAQEAGDQRDAALAAEKTSDLAFTRYRDGAADYLAVVTAQTDALTAREALLSVETQRAQASIALVRALGGPASARGPASDPAGPAAP